MKEHVARIISSRLTQRDSLLFVYGTLRPFVDIPMSRWLRHVARYVGPGRTRGRLYDLGPYPGLRPAHRSGEWVVGDVYRVRKPLVVRRLDRYEAGSGYGRPRFVRRACVVSLGRRRVRGVGVRLRTTPAAAAADRSRRLLRAARFSLIRTRSLCHTSQVGDERGRSHSARREASKWPIPTKRASRTVIHSTQLSVSADATLRQFSLVDAILVCEHGQSGLSQFGVNDVRTRAGAGPHVLGT